jgi:F-type H+-transporting ATPase subunit b
MISATKTIRIALLGLLIVACAGAVPIIHAQEPASAPPSSPQEPKQADDSAKRQPGLAQQLVHKEREAAGEEEDENAQFKQSASVRAVARLTGLELRHAYWVCLLFNFLVIGGVLVWAARKYLPGAFRDRTASIQKAMQEAQMASEEARCRLADIESRLMKLDVEIGTMRAAAEKEGAAEEGRIQAAAQEDARKIVQGAEQEIAAAAKAARRELTAYAADLAVSLAQKQIHVDAATDQALIRGFAGQLGGAPGGPGDSSGKDRH